MGVSWPKTNRVIRITYDADLDLGGNQASRFMKKGEISRTLSAAVQQSVSSF